VVFAVACLSFHGLMGWIPILDSANLALHEAGHPLVGILSVRAAVYGGTLFQIIFPLAAAWHFHRTYNAGGVAASTVWLGENLLNIARYMADARAQELPLVGSGEHDWAEIRRAGAAARAGAARRHPRGCAVPHRRPLSVGDAAGAYL